MHIYLWLCNDCGVSLYTCSWSKNIDIFNFEKVFFPINISGIHWVLVIALMQQKRILYRDALGRDGKKYTSTTLKYLVDESKQLDNDVMNPDDWVVEQIPPLDSPKQENDSDCGMFVCMYADYMLQDLPEQFSQVDMPMLRNKLCCCILEGQLLYTL